MRKPAGDRKEISGPLPKIAVTDPCSMTGTPAVGVATSA
jgi:hypothetical protein